MRQSNTRTVVEQKPLGVIDSVSAGLDLVRRRPWTLLVPILIDFVIWIAPRLSLTELLRPIFTQVTELAAATGDAELVDEMRVTIEQLLTSVNLFSIITTTLNSVTRFPSLFIFDGLRASLINVTSPLNAADRALTSPELVIMLFVPLFFLGLLLVAVYLEWIAQGVRPLETPAAGTLLLRIAQLWVRLMLYSLLLGAMLFTVSLLIGIFQMVFASAGLATFAAMLVTIGVFWVFIYFFFVVCATAVSGVPLRLAIRRSTLMFRVFFWSSIGLVFLSVFLERGLAIIWDGLTVSTIGVIVAIVANAYIGTSLLAAAMVYYQDRMNLLERWRQAAKSVKT